MNFDHDRAAWFVPREGAPKTAVLVEVAAGATTEIVAPFGKQQMLGSFYVVADGESSYGASRDSFEATHRQIGPNEWVKEQPIEAYQADADFEVVTLVDGHAETAVTAHEGDWIVHQLAGEVYVISDQEFRRRYAPRAERT